MEDALLVENQRTIANAPTNDRTHATGLSTCGNSSTVPALGSKIHGCGCLELNAALKTKQFLYN